jgi:hypothetical protein
MKIIFLFLIFIITQQKLQISKNYRENEKAISVLKNYEKTTGKTPMLSLSSLLKLKKTHKKELRKLFLKNGLKVFVNSYNKNPNEKNKTFWGTMRYVTGALGLSSPFVVQMSKSLWENKNEEVKNKIKLIQKENFEKQNQRRLKIKDLDDKIISMHNYLDSLERKLMSEIYLIRGNIDKLLNKK